MTRKMSPFIYILHSLGDRFDELSGLVMETERIYKLEASDLEKSFTYVPEVDQEGKAESYVEDIIRFQKDFPNQFRKAMIVTWYSCFETELAEIVNILNQISSSSDSCPSNEKIPWIEKLIDRVDGICTSKLKGDSSWALIDNARRLRNNIVHSDGRVKHKDELVGLKKYLEKENKYFKYSDARYYEINDGYLEYLCMKTKEYLRKVLRTAMKYSDSISHESLEG